MSFQVGDLVVNDAFLNSNIYVFKKLMPEISMALIASEDDEGACGLYSLRHATPEEIEAGHRIDTPQLEVLEMVDVSPNCEVSEI